MTNRNKVRLGCLFGIVGTWLPYSTVMLSQSIPNEVLAKLPTGPFAATLIFYVILIICSILSVGGCIIALGFGFADD